jgi:aldose 1-epimerase
VWAGVPYLDDDSAGVEFSHVSPDGDQGYPGRLDVTVDYRLDAESLSISYRATCDAATIVNLTNHTYWNLAGLGTIADHTLRIAASRYVPVDAELIPTGGTALVAGTRFDFTQPVRVGDRIGVDGIDHCFVFDEASIADQVELADPASGRAMVVTTDQPGVQLYTGHQLADRFAALCLETQLPPDTPNRPEFGSAVLRPGETYRQSTRHLFRFGP